MNETERRRGLTAEQQFEMFQMIKENTEKTNKLHTLMIGNGTKGKIQQFEEQDAKLEERIDSLRKRFWIASGAIGIIAFIAPLIADKIF